MKLKVIVMIKNIVFLLIPIIGFCQTSNFSLDDIKSINSVEMYKKVMMERGLERDKEEEDEGSIVYVDDSTKNMFNDEIKNTQLFSLYGIEKKVCFISFNSNNGVLEIEYDDLFDKVKSNCSYVKIDSDTSTEFIKYDCGDGFKIGFGKEGDILLILKYPKE